MAHSVQWVVFVALGALTGCSIDGTRQIGDTCLSTRECASGLVCVYSVAGDNICADPTVWSGEAGARMDAVATADVVTGTDASVGSEATAVADVPVGMDSAVRTDGTVAGDAGPRTDGSVGTDTGGVHDDAGVGADGTVGTDAGTGTDGSSDASG